jgi:hypothetical protein
VIWIFNGNKNLFTGNYFIMKISCFYSSAEYERVNAELRVKISTLEVVTANLKDGLIHTFQRKGGVNSKF